MKTRELFNNIMHYGEFGSDARVPLAGLAGTLPALACAKACRRA